MRFINRNLVLALCFFSISATLFAQEIIKDSVKTVKPQSINQIGNQAVKAYVVENDVTTNQEKVRQLNRAVRIN